MTARHATADELDRLADHWWRTADTLQVEADRALEACTRFRALAREARETEQDRREAERIAGQPVRLVERRTG